MPLMGARAYASDDVPGVAVSVKPLALTLNFTKLPADGEIRHVGDVATLPNPDIAVGPLRAARRMICCKEAAVADLKTHAPLQRG